ncbi:MAG: UDP-glucose/GDP-mannose dehydrogenase family protein [Candidatus Eremiobacteraeota bacterium]|nr:UDP-glucose/GDP-mannose dehydrogenase family protein [Candidatus Eremiobacteraeota bacterium]
MRISVIGLGKLGAPMAAVFAARRHQVTGLDLNRAYVAAIAEGRAPVDEPELEAMISQGRGRLTATTDYEVAVRESDVTFIIVPTPSDPQGAFSNDYVLAAVEALGAALRRKDGYHVVAVTSTVMPGSMDGPIRAALERAAKRRVGTDVGLCYNPEFVALGTVVQNMLHPDMLLIGESDPRAGAMVEAVYEGVCESKPAVHRMNFVNAEITKLSVNTFVTTKISYANMLADLCDRLAGADSEVVAAALGADTRIGHKYLRSALGYGGPCFPRDNVAFGALLDRLGAHPDIARATDAINRYQTERLVRAVSERAAPGARIAVLGMAYKPNTGVIDESQGVMLARRLASAGYAVTIHDPQALAAAAQALGTSVTPWANVADALRNTGVAVIATPWTEYAKLAPETFAATKVVIDPWRLLDRDRLAAYVEVGWLGVGENKNAKGLSATA